MKYTSLLLFCSLALIHALEPGFESEFENVGIEAPADYDALTDYANFAAIAYCLKRGLTNGELGVQDEGCPMKICESEQYKNIEIIDTFNFNTWGQVGSGYYALDHEEKRILLVFRGSTSTIDWFSNIDIVPVEYDPMVNSDTFFKKPTERFECEGCKVHRGFYNFLKNHCAKIIQVVLELKCDHPEYKLVVVGHSLGAALTLLSGMELQLMGHDPLVVSFAAPKIGNEEMMHFADEIFSTCEVAKNIEDNREFDRGFIRVVHKNDIIPKLPPMSIYRHGGFEYFINKRDLPHLPCDIERIGTSSCDELSEEDEVEIAGFSPGKLWPDSMGKYEHTRYFIKVTGCAEDG